MDKLNEINQAIRRYYAQSDVVSPDLIEAILYLWRQAENVSVP